jgi:hypothetical protein
MISHCNHPLFLSIHTTHTPTPQLPPLDPLLDEEEEDDPPCAVCGRPEPFDQDEVVFCDGCDMAVHQRCYALKVRRAVGGCCRVRACRRLL